MPIESAYVFMASMDVAPEAEDLFNEVYGEHAEYLRDVPGVRGITRMKGEPFGFALGGETKAMPAPSPVYTAIYEIDDPKVLSSPEWAAAVEKGRWATHVRPHTGNRRHAVYKLR